MQASEASDGVLGSTSIAFIEVSLFAEPDKNKSMVSKDVEKRTTNNRIKTKKKLNSNIDSHKQNMQKKWEEMYKSVEKSKLESEETEDSELGSLEEKLKHIMKLRDQNRISEQEYQERKEKLLNRL